jgi:pyrimidine operon attenuation protein/uracil phosphoribosyltransferase
LSKFGLFVKSRVLVPDKNYFLSKDVAQKKLQRMAYQVIERNAEEEHIIIAGIKDNGLVIAKKMISLLQPIYKGQLDLIEIDIDKVNLSRTQLTPEIDFNDKVVIVADDVVNGGRTLLYALKPILQYFPKKIQTLVLVERTHKAFPITADYVGLSVSTTFQEHIIVDVEGDEINGAYMI